MEWTINLTGQAGHCSRARLCWQRATACPQPAQAGSPPPAWGGPLPLPTAGERRKPEPPTTLRGRAAGGTFSRKYPSQSPQPSMAKGNSVIFRFCFHFFLPSVFSASWTFWRPFLNLLLRERIHYSRRKGVYVINYTLVTTLRRRFLRVVYFMPYS